MTEDHWVATDEANLHYLIAEHGSDLTPLVYFPGSLGSADDFRDEMKALAPRTTVSISPRGLGRSSAPKRGYSLAHRVKDLKLVVESIGFDNYYLMAYSLGVPVALAHAARHAHEVRGLILLDYPARYPQRSRAWLDSALPFARERSIPNHVVEAIQGESEPTELWDELEVVACPILVIKGGRSPTISESDWQRFQATERATLEVFEDSGHEIHLPDYDRFLGKFLGFLAELDKSNPK